jgi:hypothetical protein
VFVYTMQSSDLVEQGLQAITYFSATTYANAVRFAGFPQYRQNAVEDGRNWMLNRRIRCGPAHGHAVLDREAKPCSLT